MVVHRFFFALLPPADVRHRIGLIRDGFEDLTSTVANHRLHMTLWISADHGAVPDSLVDRLMATGAAIDAPPMSIALDRLAGSPSTIALRPGRNMVSLRALGRRLAHGLETSGARRPGWSFGPHVTLGYRRGAPFARKIAAVGWEAREVALIHSLVGETRHVLLGQWPLIPRQGDLFA